MPKPLSLEVLSTIPPAEELVRPDYETVVRALGSTGLPSEATSKRMPDDPSRPPSLPETGKFPELATQARDRLHNLLIATKLETSMIAPGLGDSEFSHINWDRLAQGYDAYERLGLQPEVVIAPEGRNLQFWKSLYGNLRQWQDEHQPTAPHRLKKQNDGDGLYINEDVRNNWALLSGGSGWSVSVLPTTAKPPVLNVNHNGKNADGKLPQNLEDLLRTQELLVPGPQLNPTITSYLTLQAMRLHRGEAPVDSETWSWLRGTFGDANNLRAPGGRWDPGVGRVRLDWGDVSYRDDFLGVRLPVWG